MLCEQETEPEFVAFVGIDGAGAVSNTALFKNTLFLTVSCWGVLGGLSLDLAAVLGILPWLGKIRICTFQDRVLIAMAKLFLQANITVALVIFGFHGALGNILIPFTFNHESTSFKIYWLGGNLVRVPLKTKVYLWAIRE